MRTVDQIRDLFEIRISPLHRLLRLHFHGRKLGHGRSDILRNVHQNGTLSAFLRDLKCSAQGRRQILDLPHDRVMLRDGHGDAAGKDFLEAVLSDLIRADIARNGDYGNTVHIGGGQTRNDVRRAGAGSRDHDTGLPGRPRVTVRRVGSALLVRGQDVLDLISVIIKRVIDIQDRAARITEHGIHTLFDQDLGNDLRTV